MHPTGMDSRDSVQRLCETHLTVIPLVDPLLTIRSRFTRGYDDWESQVTSWRRLLWTLPCKPHFLPIDLLARESTATRYEALELLITRLKSAIKQKIIKRWAEDWPEQTNGEDRTKGLVPNLEPMADKLREAPGLVTFLRGQGYDLEWM